MKSALQKLLDDCKNMDITGELNTFGDAVTVRLAVAEMERITEVIHAARETRKAQEEYYRRGRTQTALKVARQWETILDKRLASLWAKDGGEVVKQGALL